MADSVEVVTFRIGSEEYGIDISQTQEIIRMVPITAVPRTPSFMEGVINLRGQLIPIVDLRLRFGMERAIRSKDTRIIVTDIGSKRIGVIVDSAEEVLEIPVEAIELAPTIVAGAAPEYVQGVATLGNRTVIMLDLTMVVVSGVAAGESDRSLSA